MVQKLIEVINKVTCEIDEGNRFALDKLIIIDGQIDKVKTKAELWITSWARATKWWPKSI